MTYRYFPGHFFPSVRRSAHNRTRREQAAETPVAPAANAGMANSRMRRALRQATNRGSLYQRIIDNPQPVSSRGDELERRAERLLAGRRPAVINTGIVNRLTSEPGQRIPASQRRQLETTLGHPLDEVRIHKNNESAQASALLGAEAFTHGKDIFLGAGARGTDRGLLVHEAAHAIQNLDAVQRREATWPERRAWLGFFDHYLPRKFLNNYMDDTGNPITLTKQEMEDCNAVGVDIRRSEAFQNTLTRLKAAGGGVEAISCPALAGALTNGTLGNFTVRYDGLVSVDAATGDWVFVGTITFIDFWDFNTGGGNRPPLAEAKVRVANALLPGSPFQIDSEAVAAYQTQSDAEIQWTAAAPAHVPDNLLRGGADIGVGGDVGGAGGDVINPEVGGGGLDVGAEAGAQTNDDF